ncbi:MAG TPA: hypothetical protein VFT22_05740 [Kofleriaceae bacterium]|nr:hypothetical protein [Kofleriaceae bacterium]
MRGSAWVLVACAACGSVGSRSTDAPGDDRPPGTVRWARSLSSLEALGVADGPGGLVVTGAISAPANLGGDTLVPMGVFDQVIAGFDAADAAHLYSVRHGAPGTAQEFGFLHHVDEQGSPLIYGVSYGAKVDLGQGLVDGGGGPGADGYIGRYATGNASWIKRIVGPGEDKIIASAPGPGSTIYGAGWFEGTTMFEGTMLTSANRDAFVARFNTFTGDVDLMKQYGGPGRDEISSAASAGGNLFLAGMFDDTLALGGSAPAIIAAGSLDVWVGKLDSQGDGVWAVRFGGADEDRDPRLAVDAAGDVYVAGQFHGQVAFGAVNLIASGGADVFVAKLHGTDGSVAWAISIGSTGDDRVGDIAVDAAGHAVIAGTVAGPIDGGGSMGGSDAVLASFDSATGSSRWRTVYSTAGGDSGSAVTYGRDGDLYACVGIGGDIDLGTPIIGAAAPAAVLLRIVP